MKTVWRILIILLAITAVASITYALGQTQFFSQQLFAGDRFEGDRLAQGNFDGDALPFERGGRFGPGEGLGGRGAERSRDGFNLFAVTEFARTLIPIVLVATAVILITKMGDWMRTRHRKAQAESPTHLTDSA